MQVRKNRNGTRFAVGVLIFAVIVVTILMFYMMLVGNSGTFVNTFDSTSDVAFDSGAEVEGMSIPELAKSADDTMQTYYGNMSYETTEYEKAESILLELVESYGGKLESQSISHDRSDWDGMTYARGSYGISVPSERLSDFVNVLGENDVFHLMYQNLSMEDITEEHESTAGRKESLEQAITRLTELLGQTSDVSEVLAIEQQLGDLRSELYWIDESLKQDEIQVKMSHLSVSLQEVSVLSVREGSYKNKLVEAFKQGWSGGLRMFGGMLLWLFEHWLVILSGCIVGYLSYCCGKKCRRKREVKKLE